MSVAEPRRGGLRVPASVWLGALILAAMVAAGLTLALRFVADERSEARADWQRRLTIVADGRFAAVAGWLDRQFAVVGDLAENVSLQLYLTRLAAAGGGDAEMPERVYLVNLLKATAATTGFAAPPRGPDIDANVARLGVAGIALTDPQGRVLAATPGMPEIGAEAIARIGAATAGRGLLDLALDGAGEPALGFIAPIYAVQSDGAPGDRVGAVIAIKEVAGALYPLLRQPGASERTAETLLVGRRGDTIAYLSPLADGTGTLRLALAAEPSLAAAAAVARPGVVVRAADYRGVAVLELARRFTAVPWSLVYKVDVAEALGPVDARLERRLTILLLALAAVVAALVAAWRHGTSRRLDAALRRADALADRLASQRDLLRLVSDSQPAAMTIVDGDGRVAWANRRSWEESGLRRTEVVGKTLAAIVGPVPAAERRALVLRALASGTVQTASLSESRGGSARTLMATFVPLPATDDAPPRVLIAAEDVTEVVAERERRARLMNQIVDTLVGLIDRRDPHAADHSAWVATVAQAIAEEMALDPAAIACVRIAGRLMNLGKILVPEAVLTKSGPLSEAEMALVRRSLATGVDLLSGVEFPGPVVETLRQLHRRGGGPMAEDDLLTAHIVAVANALVARASPRAWRPAATLEAAVEALLAEAPAGRARRVVRALAHYIDNRGGREALAGLGGLSAA